MNLDVAFVCRLLQEEGLSSIKESRLSDDMLFDESKKAFEFIQKFFSDHGEMPKLDTLEQNIGVEFREQTPEPMSYYTSLVKKRWKGNVINSALGEADRVLIDKAKGTTDPDRAAGVLKEVIQKISDAEGEVGDVGIVDLRTNTEERWQDYLRVKNLAGKIDGYPLPWPALNDSTMGIHDGELWFVVARLKTGKTWIELVLADHFSRDKLRVLVVSMEMPISKISKRIDSVYGKLPYGDFKRGRLSQDLEVKFCGALGEWKLNEVPFWVCGKGRVQSPQDLDLLIEEIKPDVVLVDGIYLMKVKGGKGGSKWERVSTIADDLQDIALRKMVPIIGTSQFGRKVKKDKLDAGSEDIGFAYELAMNCDGLIGIFQTEDMRAGKEMLLKLMEHREGEPINLLVHWDFATMDFSQKSIVKDGDLQKDDDDDDGGRIQY